MESVSGESNGWGSPAISVGRATYLSSSESVSESSPPIYSPPRRILSESVSGESIDVHNISKQTVYPETPRIKQLRRELYELQTELELAQQIDQIKQKIKKYPR